MNASAARVIDLATFRQQRQQEAHAAHLSSALPAPPVWYPVWVWVPMPVWPVG